MRRMLSVIGIIAFYLLSIHPSFASDGPIMVSTSEFLEKFTPPVSEEMRAALKEANESFTYKGSR